MDAELREHVSASLPDLRSRNYVAIPDGTFFCVADAEI